MNNGPVKSFAYRKKRTKYVNHAYKYLRSTSVDVKPQMKYGQKMKGDDYSYRTITIVEKSKGMEFGKRKSNNLSVEELASFKANEVRAKLISLV